MNGESRVFQARWPGYCELCTTRYEAGDDIHYVRFEGDSIIAHSTCHIVDGWVRPRDRRPQPCSLVTKGQRNHETHCGTCGLEHAGEC